MNDLKYESVIGLEIHVELKTKSKMFCGCYADWFGRIPNSNTCPVCLGLPGALPVPNRIAVEWCVMLGLALNCEIPQFSKFDRKNYFYPDLAKGYQISQYDQPFAVNGQLKFKVQSSKFKVEEKTVRIRRVHLEEDTGKLLHDVVDGKRVSLIDFNRGGVPLVEIVTEPDLRSSEEARVFLKKLYQIIRYIGISDADMEKGSMRLEPNVSVLKVQSSKFKVQSDKEKFILDNLPNYKVEVKNINSFNFAKKAIDYEIARHIDLLKLGEIPKQETRGWDEKKGATYSQRSKEEAHDYRYFPEPDIPPIRWIGDKISKLKAQICELPEKKLEGFMKEFGLSEYDATILTDEKETADYFEETLRHARRGGKLSLRSSDSPDGGGNRITPKTIANWIINKKADIKKISPEKLLKLIAGQSQKVTIPDSELEKIIKKILAENPKAIADYKSGKENVLMFLLGQVMRETKGKADTEVIKKMIIKYMSNC